METQSTPKAELTLDQLKFFKEVVDQDVLRLERILPQMNNEAQVKKQLQSAVVNLLDMLFLKMNPSQAKEILTNKLFEYSGEEENNDAQEALKQRLDQNLLKGIKSDIESINQELVSLKETLTRSDNCYSSRHAALEGQEAARKARKVAKNGVKVAKEAQEIAKSAKEAAIRGKEVGRQAEQLFTIQMQGQQPVYPERFIQEVHSSSQMSSQTTLPIFTQPPEMIYQPNFTNTEFSMPPQVFGSPQEMSFHPLEQVSFQEETKDSVQPKVFGPQIPTLQVSQLSKHTVNNINLQALALIGNDKLLVSSKKNILQILKTPQLQASSIKHEMGMTFTALLSGQNCYIGSAAGISLYDIQKFQVKQSLTTAHPVICIQEIDSDTLIIGQKKGIVQFVRKDNLQIVGEATLTPPSVVYSIGRIKQKENRLRFLTNKGVIVREVKSDDQGKFMLEGDPSQIYFKGCDVRGFFEYQEGYYVVCIRSEKCDEIKIGDMLIKKLILSVKNPSGQAFIQCMVPIPDFDINNLPYVFIRDQQSISVIDVKNRVGHLLIPNSPFDKANVAPLSLMVIQHSPHLNTLEIFVVESQNEGKDSCVQRYAIQGQEYLNFRNLHIKA